VRFIDFAVTPWIAPGIPQVFQWHATTESVLFRTTGLLNGAGKPRAQIRPEDSAVRISKL
jgi:hypothetical protein